MRLDKTNSIYSLNKIQYPDTYYDIVTLKSDDLTGSASITSCIKPSVGHS